MPTEVSDHPQHLHRILRRYSAIMGQLDFEYAKSVPAAKPSDFKDDIFSPISLSVQQLPNVQSLQDDPAVLGEIIKRFLEGKDRIESDVAFIHLSCVYAVAAMVALEREDQDLAWDLLFEAGYRLGGVVVTNRAEEIFTHTVVGLYKSALGTKGAKKRHVKHEELKQRAYSVVRSGAPWRSQAGAAVSVETILKKEFGEDCLKNFENTITVWIKQMDDRFDLIPSLSGRLK